MNNKIPYCLVIIFLGFLLSFGRLNAQGTDSWESIKKEKKGRITLSYFDAAPFVFNDSDGDLSGIEADLFREFVRYTEQTYGLRIEVVEEKTSDFGSLYDKIRAGKNGLFGISSFSVTQERKKEVRFSPIYIPDYQVLVSSMSVPLVNTEADFVRVFSPLTALSVRNSTYEQSLKNLQKDHLPLMKKEYVRNVDEEIERLEKSENCYGYIELVQYLMLVKQGRQVRRQNMFKIKKTGYGFIFPMQSDWQEPVNRFFAEPSTKALINQITISYLGKEIHEISLQVSDSLSGDKEIALLTKERELQNVLLQKQALEKEGHEMQRNLMIAGFIFLIISGVMLYGRFRSKQKANLALQKKNREIDAQKVLLEKNNRLITESIHYAKRIQDAVLPAKAEMKNVFPEHFVFFRPRNIVSGDFYWLDTLEEKGEKIRIFAVADCTGHGVPGAFMSMLGTQALGDTVSRRKISEPGEILAALHTLVGSVLKQKTSGNRDGMDMSLIAWNESRRELQFAGAKNPLLYIDNQEIKQIKGSPYPVGDVRDKRLHNYETHRLHLPDRTFIYLFSDGFPDQFGGENKTKFMQKNFRELLQNISRLPAEEQYLQVDQALTDWQQAGNEVQTDDILVVGIAL